MNAARSSVVPLQLRVCRHCASSLPPAERTDFCCIGCATVWDFLHREGLSQYYDLRGPSGQPAVAANVGADHKWLESIASGIRDGTRGTRVALDVQGMHCSACVWLVEQVFSREPGGIGVVVNTAVGRAELVVEPSFDLAHFVRVVEGLGYRVGPPLKELRGPAGDLLWRLGVCIAIAMNTMLFAIATYCGLAEGSIYRLFCTLSFALSCASVLVGGTVFLRSAARSLGQRALHLDLPIALGVMLAFATSTSAYMRGASGTYFDTLDVFIALMLVGRFLQERVVLRNRADILASGGSEHIYTRRLDADGRSTLVACGEIEPGDQLVVARADLVPVDARVRFAASFSLDWINGESRPVSFVEGAVVPAGAFSCNEGAVVVVADAPFEASALASLLRTTRLREHDPARRTPFWDRLAKVYVTSVLFLAAGAFAGWLLVSHDLQRALGVVTGLLIVTCPCAFGIAAPLAYELAQAGLRRNGLFVRSPSFLDRANSLRKIVFDKTGTLTTGTLTLASESPLARLDAVDLQTLYAMVAQSNHPKSRAVARALEERGVRVPPASLVATEQPGRGIELARRGHVYRLGAPTWAIGRPLGGDGDLAFACDDMVLARLCTAESLRPDAVHELERLANLGYETALLSGDTAPRARAVAEACAIPKGRTFANATPERKAEIVRTLDDGDLLFVGDGINDALASEAATCAGTPAIDRPFMAAKSDFYVVTPGLRPVRLALIVARRLARVVRTTLGIAIAYNVVTVGLALAGRMSPLACAILMPLSSLSTVLAVTVSLGRRSSVWRS